jgi:putative addiction module component (TIGR02574 family)
MESLDECQPRFRYRSGLAAEIERRVADVRAGAVKMIACEQVRERLIARLYGR